MINHETVFAAVLMEPETLEFAGTATERPPVPFCTKRMLTVCPGTALDSVIDVTLPVSGAGSNTLLAAQSNVGVALCAGWTAGV